MRSTIKPPKYSTNGQAYNRLRLDDVRRLDHRDLKFGRFNVGCFSCCLNQKSWWIIDRAERGFFEQFQDIFLGRAIKTLKLIHASFQVVQSSIPSIFYWTSCHCQLTDFTPAFSLWHVRYKSNGLTIFFTHFACLGCVAFFSIKDTDCGDIVSIQLSSKSIPSKDMVISVLIGHEVKPLRYECSIAKHIHFQVSWIYYIVRWMMPNLHDNPLPFQSL